MTAYAVEMRGVGRRFGAVVALDAVDLSVRQGEIHALVGENGAGKTTLMRILYGADRPDSGSILLSGAPVELRSAAEGISHGIGMVSQHYSIIPELSCLENLILGAEPGWAISLGDARVRAEALARRMGFAFEWDRAASTLSPAGAQKLEILKLLWREAKIMILDEPTAMLSPADSDALFGSLKALAEDGATVIVVTHRLPEVLEHCESVTVLRGGKLVEARDVAGTTAGELAALIVGKSVDMGGRLALTPVRSSQALSPGGDEISQVGEETKSGGAEGLEISGLTVKGYRGDEALKGIGLSVAPGEILGIAGVDGSGQRELFHALAGLVRPVAGSIRFAGQDWTGASAADRLVDGLRLIPEDRHEEGVVDDWALEENAMIGLQRRPEFSSGGWLRTRERGRIAESMAKRFSTKHGGLDAPMASLSGGNQQRFVAARALEIEPKLILAFQPARGLDIEATRQVYEGIAQECAAGACAIVVSFDLDELLENCDRVVAMNRGKVFEAPSGLERDRKTIGELMVTTS